MTDDEKNLRNPNKSITFNYVSFDCWEMLLDKPIAPPRILGRREAHDFRGAHD